MTIKKCCKKSHYVRGLKSEQPIKEGAYIIAKVDLENKIIMQHRT
jgi:hypothetical protein